MDRLYWDVPGLSVLAISEAFDIRHGAGVVHRLVSKGIREIPCRTPGCGNVVRHEYRNRTEVLANRAIYCESCTERRAEESARHQREVNARFKAHQEERDRAERVELERVVTAALLAGVKFPEPADGVLVDLCVYDEETWLMPVESADIADVVDRLRAVL